MNNQTTSSLSAHDQLSDLIWSFTKPQLIYVAARLQIADLLKDGAKDAQALADSVQIDPGILHRFLRGLAWCGLVVQTEDDLFLLTPVGECLRTDLPDSLHENALSMGDMDWPVWSNMLETMKSDGTGFAL